MYIKFHSYIISLLTFLIEVSKKKLYTMFRFNFDKNDETNDDLIDYESQKNKFHIPDCKYLFLEKQNVQVHHTNKVKILKCRDHEIKYTTQDSLDSPNLPSFNTLNSDLLPGQYEGGLKVWECSLDLVHFLSKEDCFHSDDQVLELGCGVGLPGLLSFLCGAHVTFQDYNSEVLELVTATNVLLNTDQEDLDSFSKRCKFLSGDWKEIEESFFTNEKEKNNKYDIILTSETIYNKSNQIKLLSLMKSALKPQGVIYLASKVHYFGVGGGIAEFEELLKKDNAFDFSTVFKTTEGVERQILKLTFKKGENAAQ